MRRIAIGLLVLAAAGIALVDPVLSHGGHDENIRLIGSERGTQLRFVVQAEHLLWFDTDRDGLLSRAEFDHQSADIDDYVDACLNARSGTGDLILPSMRDHPVGDYHDLAQSDAIQRIRFIRAYDAEASLATLNFTCFPGTHGPRQLIAIGSPAVAGAVFRISTSEVFIR